MLDETRPILSIAAFTCHVTSAYASLAAWIDQFGNPSPP
jgi:hypothetical protein